MATQRASAGDILKKRLAEAAQHTFDDFMHQYLGQPGSKESALTPFVIVGVRPDDPLDLCEDVFRAKSKHYHPDSKKRGASTEKFKELSLAMEQIRRLKQDAGGA